MKFIKWFEEISLKSIPEVGGKTASLGEMYKNLKMLDIDVPYGFAITSAGYQAFIEHNNLSDTIDQLTNTETLRKEELKIIGKKVKNSFLNSKIPESLKNEILISYQKLKNDLKKEMSIAVRSSATAEDLPEASFAGQQESFLNVRNEDELLEKCIQCFASLYTERAISYRQDQKITQTKIALSICIQVMVRSDMACAGVMFTIDTETGFKNTVIINAAYGLGENVVKGIVNPDDYVVFRPTLELGFMPILQKKMGGKEFKLIYGSNDGESLVNIATTNEEKISFCLSNEEIAQLALWGVEIENYYSAILKKHTPMDIEWAKDGIDGKIYILQARPETIHTKAQAAGVEFFILKSTGKLLLTGDSIGNLLGQGKARVIRTTADLENFQNGEVLVAEKTEPDWEPYMKKASAIITDRGGRTCHAAIVSRELGIPAVVGTKNGTNVLLNGDDVTVACNFGAQGFVYEGILPYEHKITIPADLPRPQTKIMINIGNPHIAFKSSFIPNDGVGLLRLEFIINNTIKIHPMALVHFNEISDPQLKNAIDEISFFSKDKKAFFVDQLSKGLSMIAAAFYPKDVIVRLSDFKTNEYKNLLGGELYEGQEENPMLGFRGAYRYYHKDYQEAFALECQTIKRVREDMGFFNLKIMVPFCRTIPEGKRVIEEMKKYGLVQGRDGVEIYVMCEIPSNAILAEEFAEIFDGFSIGSNDLTQLTLGIDRDSSILSSIFSEADPAVLKLIQMAIIGAHAKNKKIGICGQRPSDDPEFVKFLVKNNIDSISLNPDAVMQVTEAVQKAEASKEGETIRHVFNIPKDELPTSTIEH